MYVHTCIILALCHADKKLQMIACNLLHACAQVVQDVERILDSVSLYETVQLIQHVPSHEKL